VACEYGQVDQVGDALKALRRAEADVPRARERAQAQAKRIVAEARARVEQARATLAEKIVAEYLAGARVAELARRSDYSRETIRRILRAAGVEPD
jgi:predicted transcriptional regulator